MKAAYPIMLDVTDRLIVIVGAGGVGMRKLRGLLDAGAKIRMVATSFREEIPEPVEIMIGSFDAKYLEGASLVFAATDSNEVNSAIVEEARRRGIWVNRADADDLQPGDFSTPAVLREGAITVTVSAAGSPALAAMVRDELSRRFDAGWSELADAMKAMRPTILASGLKADERREVFRDLASAEAMEILQETGVEGLWRWLGEKYVALQQSNPNGGP